jgi:hypothetical protein
MSPKNLEALYEYREKVQNTTLLIKQARSNPNAPVDATEGIEAQLRFFKADQLEDLIDILVAQAIEIEEAKRRDTDDGR